MQDFQVAVHRKERDRFQPFFFIFFLTALLTITHVTYNKVNNQEEMKYKCKVIWSDKVKRAGANGTMTAHARHLPKRLNNHRNHIKSKVSSCKLTEHFLHYTKTHNFDNDVVNTIIEQIKRSDMLIERKKELLRRREMFWHRKLSRLQPNRLNKRIG